MSDKPDEKLTNKGTEIHKSQSRLRTTDRTGTSVNEAMVFFYIHEFFPDSLNRYKYRCLDGKIIEADVYIPSIKVAVEYDGGYWHLKKKAIDDEKNLRLNQDGIYVIRVRDLGLPQLQKFTGQTICHGKVSPGLHMEEIITQIIHTLAEFMDDEEKAAKMRHFHLIYDDRLRDISNIESLLFVENKTPNFTSEPIIKYWDYQLNGNLDPHHIDKESVALAWFKCPTGDRIIRAVNHTIDIVDLCASNHAAPQWSVYNICPFMPDDGDTYPWGRSCARHCPYVEKAFERLIVKFLNEANPNDLLDIMTLNNVRTHPRVAFLAMEEAMKSSSAEHLFKNNLMFGGKSSDNYYLWGRNLKLNEAREITTVILFESKYPIVGFDFNWDVFDIDDSTRNILFKYLDEKIANNKIQAEIYINNHLRDDHTPSASLEAVLFPLFYKYRLFFFDINKKTADDYEKYKISIEK